MNQDQFVARRQAQWQHLTSVLDQMQRQGVRRMPLTMVQEVGRLYRQTASDLAYARTYFPGTGAVRYLNDLVGRAHTIIYAEEPQRLKSLWRFFAVEVPRTVRRQGVFVLLAAALLVVGGLIGFGATMYDHSVAEALVPEQILQRVVSPQERYREEVSRRSVMGTRIMINNILVGAKAFGLGITLGVGTAVVLIQNGLMVGAVVAQSVFNGDFSSLWAHLMAHGSLELMAIFLCGGAGLTLGWSIVAPGDEPRSVAVSRAGRQAVTLVVGSIPFFVVAATIEGFITPSVSIPDGGKYVIAVLTGLLGLAYWLLAGRSHKGEVPTDALVP